MKCYRLVAMNLALATGIVFLVSCNDEPDDPAPVMNEIGVLKSGTSADDNLPDGYRIVSVSDKYGDLCFEAEYNEEGILTAITDGYSLYDVTSSPFTIADSESSNGEIYEEKYTFYLNSSGYISKIEGSYYEEDEDEIENYTATLNLSYNDAEQLTSLRCSASGYEIEDGEKIKVSFEDNYSLTYINRRLTKVVNDWVEKDDHIDKGEITYTYKYDDDYMNVFYQYTRGLTYWMEADFAEDFLAYLGLIGKASAKLPTGASSTGKSYCSEEDEWDEYEYNYDFGSYSFNAYGAIKSADGYNYYYQSIPTSRGAQDQVPSIRKNGEKSPMVKSLREMMFKRLHKKEQQI